MLVFPLRLFAGPFSLISAGDPVLDDVRFLIREAGRSFTSLTPPLSRDEVQMILNDVDTERLSPAGTDAYLRIQEALYPKTLLSSGFFSLSAHLNIAAEARVRSNPEIPWSQRDKDSPFSLSVPVGLFFADSVQLFIEPLLARDPAGYDEKGTFFGTNLPYKAEHFELNMPLRAFIAAGGAWWTFELGRDRLSFGTAHTGNLAISDTPDYYDMARLSLFSPVFKYSLLISQMPLSVNGLLAEDTPLMNHTTQRYLYVHRLDIRLFHRFTLSLTEGVMVGNSPLELRFLNPLTIFHSFFSWRDYGEWDEGAERSDMVGSLFSIDFDWAIAPHLALYGQFVMNELTTPYEAEHFPEGQAPNATGYLLGLEYARDLAGWRATFYGEAVYTDPYLYVLSTPFGSYLWMRRLADMGSKPLRYAYLGHPAGRDALLFALGASFVKGNIAFFADLSFIAQGEHDLAWDWNMGEEYTKERTPSGVSENKFTAVFGASWRILPYLSLSTQIAPALIFNDNHESGTNEYGLDAVFRVVFSY
jgi:hypothetical protein